MAALHSLMRAHAYYVHAEDHIHAMAFKAFAYGLYPEEDVISACLYARFSVAAAIDSAVEAERTPASVYRHVIYRGWAKFHAENAGWYFLAGEPQNVNRYGQLLNLLEMWDVIGNLGCESLGL